MSLISIVQGAALRVNYPAPTVAIGSTDPNVQLMVACAQDAGDEANERVDWQALKIQTPVTFTGDGVTAAWPLPNAFQRLSPSTTFISSLYPTMRMEGPISESSLLRMKAIPMSTYPSAWREVNGEIEFYPVLGAGEIVSYVYAGKLWITNVAGAPYAVPAWTADSDLSLIPERVIRLGTIWRWKRAKGLDYSQDFDDYEAALDRIGGQESTGMVVPMADDFQPTDTWPGVIYDGTSGGY